MIEQQLEALGFKPTGMRNGLPTFKGIYLKRVDGKLQEFVDREYRPWEEEEEAPALPGITKVRAVVDGKLDQLSAEDRAKVEAVQEPEELTLESLAARVAALEAKT